MLKRKSIILFLAVSSFCLLAISGASAAGASLYLSPLSGSYGVGSIFSVSVKVNSAGDTINAAEGVLIFNREQLDVVSISKTGSIFNLWTTEPVFSNSTGEISFGGGSTVGFKGTAGTIITIRFKGKAVNSPRVSFSSGSILAADGMGTNVLATMNGAVYDITSEIITPEPVAPAPTAPSSPIISSKAPQAPVIKSITHPNPDEWYSNNSPVFNWEVPSDVTAVKLLIGKIPTASPIILYSSPISEKKIEDFGDGIWYFHARFKNAYGWGATAHRKVMIDTEPPDPFEIKIDNNGDPTNPVPLLYFNTTDKISGVAYYEVVINENEIKEIDPKTAEILKENPYPVPLQGSGKHALVVKAFDAAGNVTEVKTNIIVQPLEPPAITDLPYRVRRGDFLVVKGASMYPGATVNFFVQDSKGVMFCQRNAETDQQGNWVFTCSDDLKEGDYQIWAELTDQRGAKSRVTEKFSFNVYSSSFFSLSAIVISYFILAAILFVFIVALIMIIFYVKRRLTVWKGRFKKQAEYLDKNVGIAFNKLRKDVQKQVNDLNKKKELTEKEKQLRNSLQEAIKRSEEAIKKEIKDTKSKLK